MKRKTCFFIGHHDAPESVFPSILNAVNVMVRANVTSFLVGHYGSFDRMAARAVLAVKTATPDIALTLLSPYHPAVSPVNLQAGFDEILYPFENPPPNRFAIVKANEYAIRHSDFLIVYMRHSAGNTHKLLQYAKRISKRSALEIILI